MSYTICEWLQQKLLSSSVQKVLIFFLIYSHFMHQMWSVTGWWLLEQHVHRNYVSSFKKFHIKTQKWPCLTLKFQKSWVLRGKRHFSLPWARSSASAVNRGAWSMSAVSTISISFSLRRSWGLNPSYGFGKKKKQR